MSKCLNGIDSISFDNPAEERRFQLYLESHGGNQDLAYQAYLDDRVQRDNYLSDALSRYTIPGFTAEQQAILVGNLTTKAYRAIMADIKAVKEHNRDLQDGERPAEQKSVRKIFDEVETSFKWYVENQRKSGNDAIADEIQKIVDNFDSFEGLVRDRLRSLGLNIKPLKKGKKAENDHVSETKLVSEQISGQRAQEEIDENGEEVAEGEDSNYEQNRFGDEHRFSEQAKDKASTNIKIFMSSFPDMVFNAEGKAVPRKGYLSMRSPVNFDTLFDGVAALLSDREPVLEEYLEALQESGNANFMRLADELAKADETIKAEFVSVFTKSYVDMLMVLHSPVWKKGKITGYSVRRIRSNRNSVSDAVLDYWVENQKMGQIVTYENAQMTINHQYVEEVWEHYKKRYNQIRHAANISSDAPMVALFHETLAKLGIEMTLKQVYQLKGSMQQAIGGTWEYQINPNEKKSFISTLFEDFRPKVVETAQEAEAEEEAEAEFGLFALNNPLIGRRRSPRVVKLAKFVGERTDKLYTPGYRDGEKKLVHPYQNGHLLSSTLRRLTQSPKKKKDPEETVTEAEEKGEEQDDAPSLVAQLSEAQFSKQSLWLEQLKTKKGREVLSLFYADSMKKETGKKAKKRKAMSEAEQHLYALGLFQGAQITNSSIGRLADFITPTHSDKTVSPVIEFVKQKIEVDVEDGQIHGISEETMELLSRAIKAEAQRIQHFQENLKGKMGERFADYQKGAERFFLSPWLNPEALSKEDRALIWGESGSVLMNSTEALQRMMELSEEALIQEIRKTLEFWKANRIITQDDGAPVAMMNQFYLDKVVPYKEMPDKLAWAAADFVLNYAIFNAEYYMLIGGDPAFHWKNSVSGTLENLQKRLAKDIAPYIQGRWKKGATFTKATVLDRMIDSAERAQYHSLFGQDFYADIKSTDAQEYTTLEEHIRVMQSYGKIPAEIFTSIMEKIEKSKKGGPRVVLTGEEKEVVLQPMKPITVNRRLDPELGIMVIVYTKSSSIPLLPELTKGLELDKLRVAMERDGIDRVAHVSADKLGVQVPLEIYDKKGKLKPKIKFEEQHRQVLSRDGFGIQQEIPSKKDEILTVSQMNKLIVEGIANLSGFKYKGKLLNGKEVTRIKERLRIEMVKRGREELFDTLGVIDHGNGDYQWTDLRKVRDLILEEAQSSSRGWKRSDIEAISLTEDGRRFKFPLSLNHASRQIESLLLSVVRKELTKHKLFGKGFIQGSSAGFESAGGANNIVWVNGHNPSERLRHQRTGKNGEIISAQIIVPWYFQEVDMMDYVVDNGDGVMRLDASKVDPEILEMIGARIPNQGHSSMVSFEIVGFMNPAHGSLAIVPDEIVTQMGSDFDIDKLYGYLAQYGVVNGKLRKLKLRPYQEGDEKRSEEELDALDAEWSPDFLSDDLSTYSLKQLKQLYVDLHRSILLHKDVHKRVMEPLERPDLKEEKRLIEEARGKTGVQSPLFFRTQITDNLKNRAGKDLVATFSLFLTANAVIQNHKVRFKEGDEDENVPDMTSLFWFVLPGDSSASHFRLLSGTGASAYNKQMRTKSQNIAALMSAAVDNAKENILGYLNLNDETAHIAGLMALLETEDGRALDLSYISRFLSQSSIIRAVEIISQYRSSIRESFHSDPVRDALEVVRGELFERFEGVTEAYPSEDFYDADQLLQLISDEKNLDKAGAEAQQAWVSAQIKLLDQFQALYNAAEEWRKFRRGLLFADSNGAGHSIPELIDANRSWENITEGVFDFEDSLLESEYAQLSRLVLSSTLDLLGPFFHYQDKDFSLVIDLLRKNLGQQITPEDQQEIMSEYRSFLYTTPEVWGDVEGERKRLLTGENSLAKRVKLAQDSPEGRNNWFLQRVHPRISTTSGNPDQLIFLNTKAARTDDEEILRGMVMLLTSPDVTQRQLAHDLVAYAYLTGGRFGPTSFVNHIPMAYLEYLGFDTALRMVDRSNTEAAWNFAIQYLQHNPEMMPDLRRETKLTTKLAKAKGATAVVSEKDSWRLKDNEGRWVQGFQITRGRRKSPYIWLYTDETEDGLAVYTRADKLGDTNFFEYDSSTIVAESLIPKNMSTAARRVAAKALVRKPKETEKTTTDKQTDATLVNIPEKISRFLSPEYGSETGKERALYALSQIDDQRLRPLIPLLSAAVERLGDDFSFEMVEATDPRVKRGAYEAAGMFDPKNNGVIYNWQAIDTKTTEDRIGEVFVHELIHAVTFHTQQNKSSKFAMQLAVLRKQMVAVVMKSDLREEYESFLAEVIDAKEPRALTMRELQLFYPLTNDYEYLTGMLTNRGFQESSRELGQNGKSFFESFVDLFINLLNEIGQAIGIDIPPRSLLAESIATSLKVIEDFQPLPRTKVGAKPKAGSEQKAVRERSVKPDDTDLFSYFGAKYLIYLRKDGAELFPYEVRHADGSEYKGKSEQKQKILWAYSNNPNVDPQNNKSFRPATTSIAPGEGIDLSSVKDKNKYFEKDQAKAALANKMIGRGSEASSTYKYVQAAGDKANTGEYISSDVVFISAEGQRSGRLDPDFAEIDLAVDAGVTFITDKPEDRKRPYNSGEREVVAHLKKKGYVESSPGMWTPGEDVDIDADESQEDLTGDKYTLKNGKKANKQQRAAIDQLSKFLDHPTDKAFVLSGRAGTGKTTVIQKVLSMTKGKRVVAAAYSHMATRTLSKSIPGAVTLASALAIKLDEDKGEFSPNEWARDNGMMPILGADVFIVDETSMVSSALMEEIYKYLPDGAKVIFMGDNVQLPPMSDEAEDRPWSATFKQGEDRNRVKLTERMRSGEEHPLVKVSDVLAENVETSDPVARVLKVNRRKTVLDKEGRGIVFESNLDRALDQFVDDWARQGESADPFNWARIISYNSQYHDNELSVGNINAAVRQRLFGERAETERFIPGELVVFYAPYDPKKAGEGQMEVMNSMPARVISVSEPKPFKVNVQYKRKGSGEVFHARGAVESVILTLEDPDGNQFTVRTPTFAGLEQQAKIVQDQVFGVKMQDGKVPFGLLYRVTELFAEVHPSYAITSHKAQGQTYQLVTVLEDNILSPKNRAGKMPLSEKIRRQNQALYTAITRAAHRVTVVSSLNPEGPVSIKSTTPKVTAVTPKPAPEKAKPSGEKEVSIRMLPINKANVLAGTKTTTTRSDSQAEKIGLAAGESGIWVIEGQRIRVTARGPMTVDEAGGRAAMEQSEQFGPDGPKFPQTLEWLEGRSKLWVYDFQLESSSTEKKTEEPKKPTSETPKGNFDPDSYDLKQKAKSLSWFQNPTEPAQTPEAPAEDPKILAKVERLLKKKKRTQSEEEFLADHASYDQLRELLGESDLESGEQTDDELPFLPSAEKIDSRNLGTTIDALMRTMTREQRELFRRYRNEGFIRTRCE